jgi:hypothetical protein
MDAKTGKIEGATQKNKNPETLATQGLRRFTKIQQTWLRQLVRTERRAHAEMIPSTIGEILLQKGGISL